MLADNRGNFAVFECVPLGSTEDTVTTLFADISSMNWPSGAELRITLHADPYIEPFLEQHSTLGGGAEPIFDHAAAAKADWIRSYDPLKAPWPFARCPLRNFRLFVAVNIPGDSSKELKLTTEHLLALLDGAGMTPVRIEPASLSEDNERFQTLIANPENQAPVGLEVLGWAPDSSNVCSLVGGFHGIVDDTAQHLSPFVYSITIAVGEEASSRIKAPGLLAGRTRRSAYRRDSELRSTAFKAGNRLYACSATLISYGSPKGCAEKNEARQKSLFAASVIPVQRLTTTHASTLMELIAPWCSENNSVQKQVWFSAPATQLHSLVPFSLDLAGPGGSFIAFGRHGQLTSFSMHDQRLASRNWFMSAGGGTGKSFLKNSFVVSLRREGVPLRMLDMGYDHKYFNEIGLAAHYVMHRDTPVSVNPFPLIQDPTRQLSVIGALVADLLNLDHGDETIMKSILPAVTSAWQAHGCKALISDVLSALDVECLSGEVLEQKHALEEQLAPGGLLAAWFHGVPVFDFLDPFMVVEMEPVRPVPELFSSLVPAMITLFALSSEPGVFGITPQTIVDESWMFYGRNAKKNTNTLAALYEISDLTGGAVGMITMSMLDLDHSCSSVGQVVKEKTAVWILLEDRDFERIKDISGLVGITNENQLRQLREVHNNRPKYQEFWISAPWGRGTLRHAVCQYEYFLFTADRNDREQFNELLASGKPLVEVPEIMANASARGV